VLARVYLLAMADGIEIVRCTLGNDFEAVAEVTASKERLEWTIRSPRDGRTRVSVTALEMQVLLQMRDESRRQ
jgi:hypothetical protein